LLEIIHCGDLNLSKYTVITFAPVQGFIEKSRKLRDLYGASLLLSYLSQKLVSHIQENKGLEVISPGLPDVQKGMPNRILIRGNVNHEEAKEILLNTWKEVLQVCQTWLEKQLGPCHWEREWSLWGKHTWEVFRGGGDTIPEAMDDLEKCKLSRAWTAINWIGESSSLTGTDAIAFPGLGAETRNPRYLTYGSEKEEIQESYTKLATKTEQDAEIPEGKFIAPNERLSIPELVKRLVTWYEIQKEIQIPALGRGFTEIERRPEPTENIPGQWTGWFMGDGDRVGKHLKDLASRPNGDDEIKRFSLAMRNWGSKFEQSFPHNLGRIIYAGGDDFLGIIYSKDPNEPILPIEAYQWLLTLKGKWEEHQQKITVSVGFVWVAGSVPQRDVLQHCREAEKVAKSLGRDRVTIRVVFNSGQYVQWTCPWDYLDILQRYRDLDGNTFSKWENSGYNSTKRPNWSHIYQDLAQLESRWVFKNTLIQFPIDFFDIYFPDQRKKLLDYEERKHIVGFSEEQGSSEEIQTTVEWISNLVKVGWQLCSDIK